MLYLTSRSKTETYTAHWALTQDTAPDSGAYVPFKLPVLSPEQILDLKAHSFSQNVADILNLFFPVKLNGWDVDVLIGRSAVRLEQINHRIVIAEMWHNLDNQFDCIVKGLFDRIADTDKHTTIPTQWAAISIRIAVLFGVFGQIMASGMLTPTHSLDIAVEAGDFSAPVAAWYARQMGLPIGTIICSCDDGEAVWDFVHHGVVNTSAIRKNTGVSHGIERLIYGTLGCEEAVRFAQCCEKGRVYAVDEERLPALNQGLFAAVIGKNRIPSVISSVYRTSNYVMDPVCAASFGGLQDYRSSTGVSELTLLLSESSPLNTASVVSDAIGMPVEALKTKMNAR